MVHFQNIAFASASLFLRPACTPECIIMKPSHATRRAAMRRKTNGEAERACAAETARRLYVL